MMTEMEFLNRFQRQPNGVWACTKPINVKGPSGPVVIGQGASFKPGALFMGLDLAKELDQMAAKHGFAKPHSGHESREASRHRPREEPCLISVVPSPLARSSLTSASASSFLAWEFILRTNPVSVMIAPSGPTSLIVSLESPLALVGKLRCSSPISSVFSSIRSPHRGFQTTTCCLVADRLWQCCYGQALHQYHRAQWGGLRPPQLWPRACWALRELRAGAPAWICVRRRPRGVDNAKKENGP